MVGGGAGGGVGGPVLHSLISMYFGGLGDIRSI